MAKKEKFGLQGFYQLDHQSPYRLKKVLGSILNPSDDYQERKKEIGQDIKKLEDRLKSEKDEDIRKMFETKVNSLNKQLENLKDKTTAASDSRVEPELKKRLTALLNKVSEVTEVMDKLADEYPYMRTANPPKIKITAED